MALNPLHMISWVSLFLVLPLLLLLKKLNSRRLKKHFPPSPPKLPLIGNLHQLGASPHQSLWRLSKAYGPVMLLHLGRMPAVVISSAEAAKEALKTNDLLCCTRPTSAGSRRLTYNYLDVAFSPYGDYWREIRKLCVLELFSVKRVQSYRSVREAEVAKMIDSISDSSSSSSSADLTEKLFALTGSIIFRIAFGTSFQGSNFEHARFHQVLHETEIMLGGFSAVECFPYYLGWIIDRLSGKHREFDKISAELDRFFQQVIDDHLRTGRTKQEHEDIVDVLLKLVKEQTRVGAAQLGHDNIKAVLLDLFLAGTETSAITMVWAMAELARKPRRMKKAQEEVRQCIGNKGKVNESDITDELQYLKMIIKETLRLHPPGPLILPREAMSHFKIQGYDIEPKTRIIVNDWAIARDPQFWKDPEEFIPERFDESSIDFRGQHFEFLPFGAGRRICPGIHMGTTTVELGLANLLYWFDWKLPHGMKEEDVNMEETSGSLSLTVSKKTALNLVPVKFSQGGA